MSDTARMVKVTIIIGCIMLFAGMVSPGDDQAWNDFQEAVANSPSFPEFDDPFNRIVEERAIADSPVFTTANFTSDRFVGCNVEPFGAGFWGPETANCFNTRDGDTSYIELNTSDLEQATFAFNWTLMHKWTSGEESFEPYNVRYARMTIVCKTVEGPAFRFQAHWSLNGDTVVESTCPVGDYADISADRDYPNGTGGVAGSPFGPQGGQADITRDGSYLFDDDDSVVRITYIEFVLGTRVSDGVCEAPEGAWFPTLDEVACAIMQFVGTIVTAVQWFINGIVWLGASIAAGLIYTGTIIVTFLSLLFATVSLLFVFPGAPPFAQALLALLTTVLIVILLWSVVGLIRGGGP